MPSPPGNPANEPLRSYPAIIQFAAARLASGFAFQALSVAIGWQIYALTNSAFYLGIVGLVQFIPSLLLALPAGHLADRFNRRWVVVAAQLLQAVGVAMLALESWHGSINKTTLLTLVFLVGIGRALGGPARQAMVPGLVPAAVLPRAMALGSSAFQLAMIVGPAVGGFLYVAGPATVYAVATILYLISIVIVSLLKYRHTPPPGTRATLGTVFAGIGFIRERPVLLGVISLDLFAVLFGGATALLPIYARDILHTGPWGLGLLRAAPAVGALAMSVWLTRKSFERRVGAIMFSSVAGFGMATLVFALSHRIWLSLLALALLGAFDMVSMVIRASLIQLDTPDPMRGRVSAVNSIFINTSNQLGEFESGLLAAVIGAVGAAAVGGIGTLVVVAAWMVLFPTLRRRQRLDEEHLRTVGVRTDG